jgi:hypothetical protein
MSMKIPVVINQSSLDNGRIYISTEHEAFLGALELGGRGEEDVGDTVVIEAGGSTFEGDIRRISGAHLSPRRSFAKYLRSVGASAGDDFQLIEVGVRRYRLERV